MTPKAFSAPFTVCKLLPVDIAAPQAAAALLLAALLFSPVPVEAEAESVQQDELTFPDDTEYSQHQAGTCWDDPAAQYYGPGDYWCGPGYGGYSRPFSYLWRDRLWFRGEYLLWWSRGSGVPPLVTTSPAGTDQDEAGVLPEATILFGQEGLNTDARSGARITLGYWFDPCRRVGLEASYLGLGTETDRFQSTSQGDPILARPFFNIQPRDPTTDAIQPGRQDALLIALAGVADGSVDVRATTRFQELEVLLRRGLGGQCDYRLDFLLGYQFSRLDDDLRINESLVSTDPDNTVLPPGTTIKLFDLFDTKNEFNGADLGLVFQESVGRWSLELLMKLALGSTHSRVLIDGSTKTKVPGVDRQTTVGGLLALPSNIGVYKRDHFSVMPELGVTLGYAVTCRLRATVGYTFIYWSRVARPGAEIDLDLNPSQFSGGTLEGAPRPEFSWVTTDFWAQGLNFGLDYRF